MYNVYSSSNKKLRFPEFSEEWEEKKLGDVAEIIGGGTPDTENPDFWNGDINWFTPTEVGKEKYADFSIRKISKTGLKNSSAKLLPKGTVLLSSRATIGHLSIAINESTTNQGFQSLIVNKQYDNEFVYYLIKNINRELIRKASGSTFLEISKKEISKILAKFPSLEEQKKVANFLSTIDEKITLLDERLNFFKDFKKFCMDQLFAQKLRFKNDNGGEYPRWEERKLGELLNELNEKTTINNQYDVLSSTKKGIFLQKEYFTSNSKISSENTQGYKILRKNQLVFSPQNLWLGNINVNDKFKIGIVSPSYKIYEIKGNIDISYMKYIIKSNKMIYEFANVSEQGASVVRRNLNLELFKNIEILLPILEEQAKMANFLAIIDTKIEKLSTELENMKEFKKGLLQQMFI